MYFKFYIPADHSQNSTPDSWSFTSQLADMVDDVCPSTSDPIDIQYTICKSKCSSWSLHSQSYYSSR